MKRAVVLVLVVVLVAPAVAAAQVPADVWRQVAQQVEAGAEVTVRLRSGQRFRAVLVGTTDAGVLLQPKTRVTVPVQVVSYAEIASLERRPSGGIGAGKAAAIGVASGVGTFFAMLLILMAAVD